MSSNQHGLRATRPVSALNRSIRFSFKEFFTSLFKADAVGALSSVSLPAECGEVAWLLIQRSLLQAVHHLLKDNEALLYRDEENPMAVLYQRGLPPDDPDAITARLDLSLEESEMTIDESFFERPRELRVLAEFKTPFRQWLEMFGLNEAEATSIVNRLPSYFVHALNDQWRTRAEDYKCLQEAFDTPFTNAGAAEQAWQSYAALLQKQVDEPMFVEAFSLRQVYVKPRAYFFERGEADREVRLDPRAAKAEDAKRVVVDLETELGAWLGNNETADAIRIISGGPGSGKSSFTKMLAAQLAAADARRVLFVPLHLLELSDDLEDAVKKFIRYVDPALTNPLTPEQSAEPSLLIFDGLDELAMQGKVAAELAQQFVREVRDRVDRLNYRGSRLKVLISGRELAVQSNAAEFKRPRQILHALPYFVAEDARKVYADAESLLGRDQRQEWWSKYGEVSGRGYEGLPKDLDREELSEITSQPLLNYLVALSFTRGEIDLATESNLNVIYRDLLKAVYERGWAKGNHPALRGVDEEQFVRWLEEIAVAAWHGDGRTTTVEEIKGHARGGGAANLLKLFEEGEDKGITRLLMAFYFRRAGVRDSSGEKTFEFTHKSFGEYLTAKRVVRLLGDMEEELKRHEENVDKGWDEREALKRWIILCGPSPLDEYLFKFIENEIRLAGPDAASSWQEMLCALIGFELRNGLPMETLNLPTFKEATRQARNAEEALIVVLHACALTTKKLSNIDWPLSESSFLTSFGELLSRLHGQRGEFDVTFILRHLGFLNLQDQFLNSRDLFLAELSQTTLTGTILLRADLKGANLTGANLTHADLTDADLTDADLTDANLSQASLDGADLDGAVLSGVIFNEETRFVGVRNLKAALFDSEEQTQAILKLAEEQAADESSSDDSEEQEG